MFLEIRKYFGTAMNFLYAGFHIDMLPLEMFTLGIYFRGFQKFAIAYYLLGHIMFAKNWFDLYDSLLALGTLFGFH